MPYISELKKNTYIRIVKVKEFNIHIYIQSHYATKFLNWTYVHMMVVRGFKNLKDNQMCISLCDLLFTKIYIFFL